MREILSEWVGALAGAGVFCAVLLALCPKGRVKRVARLAAGLIMALALLSPLAKPDTESLLVAFSRQKETIKAITSDTKATVGILERRVIERDCAAYIMDRAAALGADLSSVDVTARWSDEGFWYPWSCTLTAAGYSFALSESVEANLGIPAERQSWEEGG